MIRTGKILSHLLVLIAFFSGCGKSKPVQPSSSSTNIQSLPISIGVMPVRSIMRQAEVSASGSVEAHETYNLAFQVGGRIAEVKVQEGQLVKVGQILATLDALDYRLGLDAAMAQAAQARAVFTKAKTGPRIEEVAQTLAAYNQASDEYRRMKFLYERKSMAPNDFKKVEAAYLIAKDRYEIVRSGTRQEDIAAARAAYEATEAQVRVAKKKVSDGTLISPRAGIISRRGINPGETVGTGTSVFTLMDISQVRVKVGVPESDIGRVHTGLNATVAILSIQGDTFHGKVELINPSADPASRTYAIRLLVPNPNSRLMPGMIAEAKIKTLSEITATVIPGDAVIRDLNNETKVFIYAPDRRQVYSRRVDVGRAYDRDLEIKSGLRDGELIVVAGQHKLRDGISVKVQENK